jgi:lysozyme
MQVKGIDISKWQGAIDFQKVKNSGIKFVIIRAGYGTKGKDEFFEANYKKAKAAGLHVGAYWYSYADGFKEASEEADAFLRALFGKQFDYPVYLDMEEKSQLDAGMDFCSGLIKTFCGKLEAAGYFAGFYTSSSYARAVVKEESPEALLLLVCAVGKLLQLRRLLRHLAVQLQRVWCLGSAVESISTMLIRTSRASS